jgi:hypothetical protein
MSIFYEYPGSVVIQSLSQRMNIWLHFKVNTGREYTLKLTIVNKNLHEISIYNRVRGVNFS